MAWKHSATVLDANGFNSVGFETSDTTTVVLLLLVVIVILLLLVVVVSIGFLSGTLLASKHRR